MLGERKLPRGRRVDGAWEGSNRGDGLLGAAIVGSLLGILHWGERRGGDRRGHRGLGGREPRAPHDHFPELGDRGTPGRVELKDAPENVVQLRGDGQNGPEELGILHVGTECAVLEGGTLPWVAATGQIHKDDSQAPDIVGR